MKENIKLEKKLVKESIFIIGRVLSVSGRGVRIKLNKNKNHSHILYEGKTVKNVSVGGYVKIIKGFIRIIGKVEGEEIKEEKDFNKEYKKEEIKINRILRVSLFGHFEGNDFRQGIKEMPLIDNECYLLDRDEFNKLHKFYKDSERSIAIGSLTEEPSQEIRLGINNLFANHIGIFGNTGSGKSNTLAKIYTELFEEVSSLKKNEGISDFVIIDFNGEYVGNDMITNKKIVYELSTKKNAEDRLSTSRSGSEKKYPITIENLNEIEILSILLEATEKTQKPFLARVLGKDKDFTNNETIYEKIEEIFESVIDRKDKNMKSVIVELFDHLSDLVLEDDRDEINEMKEDIRKNLHYHSKSFEYYWGTSDKSENYNNQNPIYEDKLRENVKNLKFKEGKFNKLKLKIILNYFYEIAKGYSNQEHIAPLIGRVVKRFDMLEKLIDIKEQDNTKNHNLSILCLRDVNIEMKKIIPLIVCKRLYERKKDSDKKKSLHIIVDEAHNILSDMSQRESGTLKDYRLEIFEEMIKEGRKFGVFLTIVSQRPRDISETIISQLHNYFIHRLVNENDIKAVERTVAYLDKLSFESIPILSIGSCFVAGLASDIPVKVKVDLLEKSKMPKSETVDLEGQWL